MTSTLLQKASLLTFILVFIYPSTLFAKNLKELNSEFITSYRAYQEAVKTNSEEQLSYALKAYQLGKQVYGEEDINTANLATNLAEQYIFHKEKAKAQPLLLESLKIFKSKYGKNAIELTETYIALGNTMPHDNREKAEKYYVKALNIAKEHQEMHPFISAEMQLKASIALLGIGSPKSRNILQAQEFFTEKLPSNDKRVVNANFYAGKYYLARNKYNKAIKYWRTNLPVFNALEGATHPLELNTRAFLINALEKTGKSEEATKHCIAIGSMTPWDDSQEQRPLFRSHPKYPVNNARRGQSGWVKIGFTVSEVGTVINPEIIESKGGKGFEKSSLAALDKWRYAPKFEDGQPVEAYTTVRLDFKIN